MEDASDCLESSPAGPKAGKVSVPPFQRGAGSRGRAPAARRNGRNTFPKGAFYFGSTFLFARKKERWKPCAPCRGRHPGRGAAGLLVTNGGQPFGAEKPDGPVPGGRADCPSKTPRWGVFESSRQRRRTSFWPQNHPPPAPFSPWQTLALGQPEQPQLQPPPLFRFLMPLATMATKTASTTSAMRTVERFIFQSLL